MSKPSNLVQGTLDLLILKILDLEPRSGWAIGQRLKQVSNEALQVSDGSLYPALHKLEQQGWISAEWRNTENNRRAKIYSLTPPGRRYLGQDGRELGAAVAGHHPRRAPDRGVRHALGAVAVRVASSVAGVPRRRPGGP